MKASGLPAMSDKELDFSQSDPETDVELPDDPGPALAGKTPVVGSVRRGLDMPVLRDELKDIDANR